MREVRPHRAHWLSFVVAWLGAMLVGVLLFYRQWWYELLGPLLSELTHGQQSYFVGIAQLVVCAVLIAVTARRRVLGFSLISFFFSECLLVLSMWRYNQQHSSDHIVYSMYAFADAAFTMVLFAGMSWCWWRCLCGEQVKDAT
jgi:hypothetical protein